MDATFLTLVPCHLILSFVKKFDLIALEFGPKKCNCTKKKFKNQFEKKKQNFEQ
jgi:hypothetical protein